MYIKKIEKKHSLSYHSEQQEINCLCIDETQIDSYYSYNYRACSLRKWEKCVTHVFCVDMRIYILYRVVCAII